MRRQPKHSGLRRLGGELPLFCDRLGARQAWAPSWLAFSHGRAALAWLIESRKPKAALLCAYTCPSVPVFLRLAGLETSFYDFGAGLDDIFDLAKQSHDPRLVILPALFGDPPWLDAAELTKALGPSAIVVIDAAQTAFGHHDFCPPPGTATLSCPRKTTALSDGAVLALGKGITSDRRIAALPVASEAAAYKHAARALWTAHRPDLEEQAIELNRRSEQSWPDGPHRMTDELRVLLERLDAHWHRTVRRRNRRMLAGALANRIATWASDKGTPFSLPVFVRDPTMLLAKLRERGIFANALWPNAEHNASRHPAAAYLSRHLVSLPVDQRCNENDMALVAAATLRFAGHPAPPPPAYSAG